MAGEMAAQNARLPDCWRLYACPVAHTSMALCEFFYSDSYATRHLT